MKIKKAICWAAVGLGCILLTALIVVVIGMYQALTGHETHEFQITGLVHGVGKIDTGLAGQWRVSFRSEISNTEALKTPVQCQIRNTGKPCVWLLDDILNKRTYVNNGLVMPKAQMVFYRGELGQLLRGDAVEIGSPPGARAVIEIDCPADFVLKAPIKVFLTRHERF